MYVCLYLYVYLFYCVYCVPCTANRKPVCHFTCGLLTFTEARRDRTTAHRLHPACRPDAESLGAAQCQCRLPWHVAFSHSTPVGAPTRGRGLSMPCTQCVRPTRRRRRRMCMPCRCMPNPLLATGNCTRHVCAADNLQTNCKQQAPESPPQSNTRKPCRNWGNARPQAKACTRHGEPPVYTPKTHA